MYQCYYDSPLGTIVLSSNGKELIGLEITDSYLISKLNKIQVIQNDDLEIFIKTRHWLERYFKGENPNPSEIPIYLEGSKFSLQVWEQLKQIPYGKTITYGEIASSIAEANHIDKMSSQAVGHAIGHNPIAIIIPCHRVIGVKGNLTGYNGGIDKKIKLLEVENVDMKRYFVPKKKNFL